MLSALYAIARLSVCPFVRPSVTRVYHRKTVEVRIMKFSPYGSPIPLILRGKFHPEILRYSPERGRQTREGWVKSAVFTDRTNGRAIGTVLRPSVVCP